MDLTTVGGRRIVRGDGLEIWDFGWRGPGNLIEDLSDDMAQRHATQVAAMPTFGIQGSWQLDQRRYALWRAPISVTGSHLKYIWQVTGSCVGAGGCNMLRTGMCVEILAGDNEEFKEVWWPYTYGKSRYRSGMTRPGEGSTGAAWAEAICEDGFFAADEPGLPTFREVDGWLKLDKQTEIQWSDGDDIAAKWNDIARHHLYKTASRMKSKDDCIAALANGYCITQASMFGFRSSKVVGTPPVRIAPWDGSWSHQTYVDEFWDHPTEGEIFRWGNNWGPTIHGSPTGDEPSGGVYIRARTMDEICRTGEVYAFAGLQGFQARKLPWAERSF